MHLVTDSSMFFLMKVEISGLALRVYVYYLILLHSYFKVATG